MEKQFLPVCNDDCETDERMGSKGVSHIFHHELREQCFIFLLCYYFFSYIFVVVVDVLFGLLLGWCKHILCLFFCSANITKRRCTNEYNVTPMEWKITSGTTSVDAIFMFIHC